MDQYLYIPFLGGWTSIYQLFWCSPGVQGFDTLPYWCLSKFCYPSGPPHDFHILRRPMPWIITRFGHPIFFKHRGAPNETGNLLKVWTKIWGFTLVIHNNSYDDSPKWNVGQWLGIVTSRIPIISVATSWWHRYKILWPHIITSYKSIRFGGRKK